MTRFRRLTDIQMIGSCITVLAGYQIFKYVTYVPPQPRSAPPIDEVISNAAAISMKYIKPAHIRRKGLKYEIVILNKDHTPDLGVLPFKLEPLLFRETKRDSCANTPVDAVYDYELQVGYYGEQTIADETPEFAFDSCTRRLVYLNRPGECGIASEALRKQILAVRLITMYKPSN